MGEIKKYPAPFMSITELHAQMNFPTDYLYRMSHHRYSYKYITRTSGKRNSKIIFDTEEFEKLRKRGILI